MSRKNTQQIVNNDTVGGPIFIVGMNGSGTTLMQDCLNRHSNIYIFPGETRIIPHYIKYISKYGDLEDNNRYLKLWDDLRKEFIFRSWNGGIEIPMPVDWKNHERTLFGVFDSIFNYFASKVGKKRWGEKTPMHALHISNLAFCFPSAKFIHVIRDGRDSAASFNRRWGYDPEMTIYRWKTLIAEARKQGATLDNAYTEIRYEHLTMDPEKWLRKICDFIGEQFQETMLVPAPPGKRIPVSNKIIVNSNKWVSYFDSRTIAKLENIAGKALSEMGYPTKNPNGNHDLNKILRYYRMTHDHLRVGVNLAMKALRNNKYGIFQRIVRLSMELASRIKQRSTTRY